MNPFPQVTTEGPWLIECTQRSITKYPSHHVISDNKENVLALIPFDSDASSEKINETQRNAILIQKSPQMLEVLIQTYHDLHYQSMCLIYVQGDHTFGIDTDQNRAQLRDVIASAMDTEPQLIQEQMEQKVREELKEIYPDKIK